MDYVHNEEVIATTTSYHAMVINATTIT